MDDIAYTYICAKLTLADRQEFLLKGKAWKNLKAWPLDKLLLTDLQEELRLRDKSIRKSLLWRNNLIGNQQLPCTAPR